MGLNDEADLVNVEDFADQLAFSVVLELPDPGEIPKGVQVGGESGRHELCECRCCGASERGTRAECKCGRDGIGASKEATA
jgi:hypothetical protein